MVGSLIRLLGSLMVLLGQPVFAMKHSIRLDKRTLRKAAGGVAAALLLALAVGNCGIGDIGAPKEVVSPAGCLKSEGRYFDPISATCVRPADPYQVRRLNAYRRVHDVANDKSIDVAEFSVGFSTYLHIDAAEALWADLREEGAQMNLVSGLMPSNTQYDVQPGQGHEILDKESFKGQPRVWGDGPVSLTCGWHKRFDASAPTLKGMLVANIESSEKDSFVAEAYLRPEFREAVESGLCRIQRINVTAAPKVIRRFWDRHLDMVEGIQTRLNQVDRVQPSFGPIKPMSEGGS